MDQLPIAEELRQRCGPVDKTYWPWKDDQDDNDQMDHVVMSERMRGKRPIRAMDTLDEAESSAHAERRARQQREATQRANNRLSPDYGLAGMWADGIRP
jgi:hypothetical protein